jgi:hypothetical protein
MILAIWHGSIINKTLILYQVVGQRKKRLKQHGMQLDLLLYLMLELTENHHGTQRQQWDQGHLPHKITVGAAFVDLRRW